MIFFRCMPWGGSPTGVSRPIFYEALPGGKGPDSRRLSIFFCADHSNIAVSGIGLGLSTVKHIVASNGGRI
jgi:hypothetical protein